jgi:YidC/Oxa1 family membrane protein insertase
MRLYQTEKVNPLTGWLPLVLQVPFFLAVFHIVERIDPLETINTAIYGWTQADWASAAGARIFGTPIGARFSTSAGELLAMHANGSTAKLVSGAGASYGAAKIHLWCAKAICEADSL